MVCPKCNGVFPEGVVACPDDGTPLLPDSVIAADWGGDTLSSEHAPTPAREGSVPVIQGRIGSTPGREPSAPAARVSLTTGPRRQTLAGAGAQSPPQRGGAAGMELSDAPLPVDAELLPGTMAGEYQITGLLGTGGMGSVYSGVQPVIGKRVAIKVLLRELATNPQVLYRFMQEARAVNQAQSRYIVDIFSFGELPDGRHYFVMEQLEGQSLRDFLRARQTLSFDEAFAILSCVCKGLIAAHGKGIVHRDIKPENIMVKVEEDGAVTAKILDFGIAKLQGGDSSNPGFSTRTGAAMGTPYYMSPEQCRGISVDHRTDIYALGIIIYEIFTGALPFTARSYIDLVNKHLFASPPLPSQLKDTVSKPLESLILRCIAKDPVERPQSVEQLLEELTQLVPSLRGTRYSLSPTVAPETPFVVGGSAPEPSRARGRSRRPLLLVAAILLVSGGAGAAYLALRGGADATGTTATEPGEATLKVSSRPAGATVFLDGVAQPNRTPLLLRVAPGQHKLRVVLDGHEPAEEVATLVGGKELVLSYSLRPTKVAGSARLIVSTGHPSSSYFLDGRSVGQGATLQLEKLEAKAYRLRVTTPGRVDAEQALTLTEGETSRLTLTPAPTTKIKTAPKLPAKKVKKDRKGGPSEDPDETLNPFKKKQQP